MAKYIISRFITTTTPKQTDYYNGEEKSIWSKGVRRAKVFNSYADTCFAVEDIKIKTFETYPINIMTLK